MTILVIVGNDKLGRKFINSIDQNKYEIVLDGSSSIRRVFKLIRRGTLKISLVIKMIISDLSRRNHKLAKEYEMIKSNNELINIVTKKKIEQVILYRGGLIVNRKFLDTGVKILNIHCAKIPEYGGIGVLYRALQDQSYQQEATLHVITERIDSGEVLAVEPYELNKNISYKENEEIAYNAGTRLFKRHFG